MGSSAPGLSRGQRHGATGGSRRGLLGRSRGWGGVEKFAQPPPGAPFCYFPGRLTVQSVTREGPPPAAREPSQVPNVAEGVGMGWRRETEGHGWKQDLRVAPNKHRRGAVGFPFNARRFGTTRGGESPLLGDAGGGDGPLSFSSHRGKHSVASRWGRPHTRSELWRWVISGLKCVAMGQERRVNP